MNLVFKKDDMQSTLRKGLGLTLRGLKEQRKIIPARIVNERIVAGEKIARAGRKSKHLANRGILPKLRHAKRLGKQKVQLAKRRVSK